MPTGRATSCPPGVVPGDKNYIVLAPHYHHPTEPSTVLYCYFHMTLYPVNDVDTWNCSGSSPTMAAGGWSRCRWSVIMIPGRQQKKKEEKKLPFHFHIMKPHTRYQMKGLVAGYPTVTGLGLGWGGCRVGVSDLYSCWGK